MKQLDEYPRRRRGTIVGAWPLAVIALACAIAGCRPSPPQSPAGESAESTAPATPQPIRLVAIDDGQQLADRLARLWQAETGGELTVEHLESREWNQGLPRIRRADLLLYPSVLLGELAAASVPQTLDRQVGFGEGFDANTLLPLDRSIIVQNGRPVVAVSLGSPLWMLVTRTDVLDSLGLAPPSTWDEYSAVARALRENAATLSSGDSPLPAEVCEPWSGPWSVEMFLARALAHSAKRGRLSSFFDATTMDALIDSPPYVAALEEMLSLPPRGEAARLSPLECYQKIVRGEAAMAITFVTGQADVEGAPASLPIHVAPLPAARRWYDYREQTWKDSVAGESNRVVVVPVAGWLVSLNRECRRVRSSVRLLNWLCTPEAHRQLALAAPDMAPIFRSQLDRPHDWVNPQLPPSVAQELAEATQAYHDDALAVSNLRIPHRFEYVEALRAAIESALNGSSTAAEALSQCARQWDELTDRFGRDAMRQQFRKSVGIDF
jgi:multiple sugar transport system substrate-binding protein